MPIIEMHLMVGRSVEQKRAVAEAVAEAVTRTLGVGPEQVRLLITEHGSEEFSVGGVTAGVEDRRNNQRRYGVSHVAAPDPDPTGRQTKFNAGSGSFALRSPAETGI